MDIKCKKNNSQSKGTLTEAYFVGAKGFSDETIRRIENSIDIDAKKGRIKTVIGVPKIVEGITRIGQCFGNDKALSQTGVVSFAIYDVRDKAFNKIFPRT